MTVDLSKFSDTEILAKTAWGENRGGGIDGMTSVLNVIVNRSKKPSWWGKTAREVCLKSTSDGKIHQFSSWNENDHNFEKLLDADDDAYTEAMSLATKAISGDLADLTNGSCYYFAKTLNPWPVWARGKQPSADIAGQLFFNNVK